MTITLHNDGRARLSFAQHWHGKLVCGLVLSAALAQPQTVGLDGAVN